MPTDEKPKTVSEAALQTLDILIGVVNVLEKMWEATPMISYNLEVPMPTKEE